MCISYSQNIVLYYKPESLKEISNIEKENNITQEDDACFGPSKCENREAKFLPKILGLF